MTKNPQNNTLDVLTDTKRKLLLAIKAHGAVSAAALAQELQLTREAARQQLQQLQEQNLLTSQRQLKASAGRPALLFSLSEQGEHLFPKHYDKLSLLLIDTLEESCTSEQFSALLSQICDKQVQQWQAQLNGLSLKEKLIQLKNFYFTDDPYTQVIDDQTGLWLVETSCPYLNLAMRKEALCDISVNTLSRLLGVKVVREKRFQNGDGQCAFRIYPSEA